MTHEPKDMAVENTLLRASLFLTANVLKDYHEARHTKSGDGRLQLAVPETVRDRAGFALTRAREMLVQDQGRGR